MRNLVISVEKVTTNYNYFEVCCERKICNCAFDPWLVQYCNQIRLIKIMQRYIYVQARVLLKGLPNLPPYITSLTCSDLQGFHGLAWS